MQPRRWGVGARHLVASVLGIASIVVAAGACARPGMSTAPEPQFTGGRPPATVLTAETTLHTQAPELPELSAVEPDVTVPPTEVLQPTGDVDSMIEIDDVGNITPNAAGWRLFDDALAARLFPGDVSASVAVMIDGTLIHTAAFGERIAGSGEPVDVTDRFRIASISKVITATVTLRLVEQGLLGLDQPVGQLLADHLLLGPVSPETAAITVRQLLSHTSGFPKHQNTFFGGGALSYAHATTLGLTGSIGPSGQYVYSNMNFAALSVLIEAVTGATYENVVAQELLTPLGITGMRLTGTHDLGPDEVSHHPAAGRTYMEALGGAGAWNATPSDVVTILNAIDPKTPGWKALSPATMSIMRYTVPTGLAPDGYGLGLINYEGDAWGHTGTIENAHSMVLVQPDGVTWAVSVSGETPSQSEALRRIVGLAMAGAFPPSGRTG